MRSQLISLAKNLIKFKTDRGQGINWAKKWLISWSKKNNFQTQTWSGLKSFLIQTNPNLKKHFCFVTHLDVVPANKWSKAFQPKTINNSVIGRGAVDDKGPLAVCLEVLKNVKQENCNVSILIITDEETKNKDIAKIIHSGKFKPDFCLVADGGELNKFDIGQKGNLWLTLTAKTNGGNAAFANQGFNAANVLNQFIADLKIWGQKLPSQKPFTPAFINISRFEANTEPLNFNKIAKAKLQIAFPPPQTGNIWLKKIRQNRQIKTKVDFQSTSHLLTDGKWLKLIKTILPTAKLITAGAPNLAHDLHLRNIPAISHCPTRKYLAHCNKESINIVDLIKGKELYISLVKNFVKMR